MRHLHKLAKLEFRMRRTCLIALCTSALCLSACSKDAEPQAAEEFSGAGAVDVAADDTEKSDVASVGTAAQNNFDCDKYRDDSSEKIDILGITLGMQASEAFERLACSNAAFTVEYSKSGGFFVPSVPGEPEPYTYITADAGTENVKVTLSGLSGYEKVVFIERSAAFPEGKLPSVQSLEDRLSKKYGALFKYDHGNNKDYYARAYSPNGDVFQHGSRQFKKCSWDAETERVTSQCGLTIAVMIKPYDGFVAQMTEGFRS